MADVSMCGFERRTAVGRALEILFEHVPTPKSESVGITEAAGRVASSDVVADANVPHFDRAMMDGYAVVAEATFGATEDRPRELHVAGEQRAGRADPTLKVTPHRVVRVTTGAPVPQGADAVVMAEQTEVIAASEAGERIAIMTAVSPGKHIGAVGEDITRGQRLLQPGRLVRPQDAGVVASCGIAQLDVYARPRVALLVTGDELLQPGQTPMGGRIVDSNSIVLKALIERDGGQPLATTYVPDDADSTRRALLETDADVILVSGGSSVGPEDHAPRVLERIGHVLVHGVAMRPSSPAGFGRLPKENRDSLVFLLPGNPVSCLCAYEFFAGPAIRMLGGRPKVWPHRRASMPAAAKFVSPLGRTDYTRVTVHPDGVRPLMTSGASLLSSTTRADGVVIIEEHSEGHAAGDVVEVLFYD